MAKNRSETAKIFISNTQVFSQKRNFSHQMRNFSHQMRKSACRGVFLVDYFYDPAVRCSVYFTCSTFYCSTLLGHRPTPPAVKIILYTAI